MKCLSDLRVWRPELAALPADVLVSVWSNASPYAKNATTTIPVVFILVADPIGSKLVDSLARPSGNATGLSDFAAELIGKRLQLLKETIPGLTRVATLANPNAPISRLYIELTKSAAAALALANEVFEVRSLEELEPAFVAMASAGMQALTTNPDGLAFQQRTIIAKLAIAHHLPLVVWSRETLEAGALMSYGPDHVALCRRAAIYVDKILKGAKPSELPWSSRQSSSC